MLKVLMLNSEYNGCAYWRMFEPARFLNMYSKKVAVTYFPHENYQYRTVKEWEALARNHDVIVFGRVSTPEAFQTLMVVREISRKPIVVELDDDWTCVDEKNIAYRDWHPESKACLIANEQMEKSDIYQISTRYLKRVMVNRYGKPSWISPNLIDIDKMDAHRKIAQAKKAPRATPDEIRVGWAGSATHYGDFLPFLPAMKIIGEKYPNVKFVFRGMQADFFVSSEDKVDIVDGRQKITMKCPVDVSRVEYAHGCDFWDWPNLLAEMDLDIVMVPLADTKFNRSKSNCRYLEFSSLKIPGVYFNSDPYKGTVYNGVTGYLAKDTRDWVRYLSDLIENEVLRKEMGEKAYQDVLLNWSLQNNICIWEKNYLEMAEYISKTNFVSYYNQEV